MNIPNSLTLGRIVLVPLIVWLIITHEMTAAFLLFLLAGFSDAADGFLAKRYGWRYTRYADDLTFSLPESHQGEPKLGALMGLVRRVVESEGFAIHDDKTRVARSGGRQKITGLVVNGPQPPRVPRKLRRQLRAALHNLKNGKPLKEGESMERLEGFAAYVCMTDRKLGAKLLQGLREKENGAVE